MKIGFIGIGGMGAAIVPHLVKAGHTVSVWNRNRAAAQAVEGVTMLDSPSGAFENEVVITMLSDDAAVRDVVINSGALAGAGAGAGSGAGKDKVHIMMSTISLALVDELDRLHRDHGIGYVAAPVFGVPAVAAAGQLNILVAGERHAVAKVQPLLDVMGQKSWFLGTDPRHANVAKLSGNLMITLAIEAMGEATALTESYGLKAADFLNVVTNTIFASPSYKRYGANIGNDQYEPGFKLSLGLKDVNLALEAAGATQTPLPSAHIVRAHMQDAVAQGWGAKDWSILAKLTRR